MKDAFYDGQLVLQRLSCHLGVLMWWEQGKGKEESVRAGAIAAKMSGGSVVQDWVALKKGRYFKCFPCCKI